jgi:hypothetical protein
MLVAMLMLMNSISCQTKSLPIEARPNKLADEQKVCLAELNKCMGLDIKKPRQVPDAQTIDRCLRVKSPCPRKMDWWPGRHLNWLVCG